MRKLFLTLLLSLFAASSFAVEIGHSITSTSTNALNATTTWITGTNMEILGTNLVGSSDYVILFMAIVAGDQNATNTFEFRIVEDDGTPTVLTASEYRIEVGTNSTTAGHPYCYLARQTTPATPNDYEMQLRVASGTQEARILDFYALALRLDDLAAGDFRWAEDTTAHIALDNTSFTDGASITLPAGSDDWGVWSCVHTTDPVDFSAFFHQVIDVDGTDHARTDYQHEDAVEEYSRGTMTALVAPGAITVKNQFQTNSATAGRIDVDNNRIFGLKLNAFEDHGLLRDNTATAITAVDTDTVVGTLGFTTVTAASRDWAFVSSVVYDGVASASGKQFRRRLEENVLGNIAGANTDLIGFQGNISMEAGTLIGELASVANSTTFDIDTVVQENTDVSVNPQVTETHIVAFTWELATTQVLPPILDPQFRRRR